MYFGKIYVGYAVTKKIGLKIAHLTLIRNDINL